MSVHTKGGVRWQVNSQDALGLDGIVDRVFFDTTMALVEDGTLFAPGWVDM